MLMHRCNGPLVAKSDVVKRSWILLSWTQGGTLSAVQLFGRPAVLETHTLRY